MSEWRNPVWPTPLGEIPINDGVYWVSMYGWVRIGHLYEISKGRRIRICYQDGSPMKSWDGVPINDFRRHRDTLYTAWKPMTAPESWERSDDDRDAVSRSDLEKLGETLATPDRQKTPDR